LVNSYSMLLRPDVLALPDLGAVNLHGALLPEQRAPIPLNGRSHKVTIGAGRLCTGWMATSTPAISSIESRQRFHSKTHGLTYGAGTA
jgi:hypothetical protein